MNAVADERPHIEAILAAINTNLPDNVRAYDFDDVPGDNDEPSGETPAVDLPRMFAKVDLQRRGGEIPRPESHRTVSTGWRVTVEAAGFNRDECAAVLNAVTEALEGRTVMVRGRRTTALDFESGDPIERAGDRRRYVATRVWTYTH